MCASYKYEIYRSGRDIILPNNSFLLQVSVLVKVRKSGSRVYINISGSQILNKKRSPKVKCFHFQPSLGLLRLIDQKFNKDSRDFNNWAIFDKLSEEKKPAEKIDLKINIFFFGKEE